MNFINRKKYLSTILRKHVGETMKQRGIAGFEEVFEIAVENQVKKEKLRKFGFKTLFFNKKHKFCGFFYFSSKS